MRDAAESSQAVCPAVGFGGCTLRRGVPDFCFEGGTDRPRLRFGLCPKKKIGWSRPSAGGETITDFDATNAVEDIVLSGLLSGTFSYLGASTFTGGGNTEIIFDDTSKLLSIDSNGDANVDIAVSGGVITLGDTPAYWTAGEVLNLLAIGTL